MPPTHPTLHLQSNVCTLTICNIPRSFTEKMLLKAIRTAVGTVHFILYMQQAKSEENSSVAYVCFNHPVETMECARALNRKRLGGDKGKRCEVLFGLVHKRRSSHGDLPSSSSSSKRYQQQLNSMQQMMAKPSSPASSNSSDDNILPRRSRHEDKAGTSRDRSGSAPAKPTEENLSRFIAIADTDAGLACRVSSVAKHEPQLKEDGSFETEQDEGLDDVDPDIYMRFKNRFGGKTLPKSQTI